jgi:hypothetical protein
MKTNILDRLLEASMNLAVAIKEERMMYIMMDECPKDEIEKALKEWESAYEIYKRNK